MEWAIFNREAQPLSQDFEPSPRKYLLFIDLRTIPLAIVCLSLAFQSIQILLYGIMRLTKGAGQDPLVAAHEEDEHIPLSTALTKLWCYVKSFGFGGQTIFCFMSARFFGSVLLFLLSTKTIKDTCGFTTITTCPEASMAATFLYASVMSAIALVSPNWCVSVTRFNVLVLLSTLAVYFYRDIWPLATYDKLPEDADEGNIVFLKIGILFFISVVTTLFAPRRYIPVDPANPMPIPNPEQTASIFSLLTYTFLDSVIFLAYKLPHLGLEHLPPYPDYNGAKYQTAKSFPHLDIFSGAKRRHLFFGFLRVFWKEYILLVAIILIYTLGGFVSPIGIYNILKYLETDGKGQIIKPWFWIIWLSVGPMLQGICWQAYTFTSHRVMALMEMITAQLVFEHSLRIRLLDDTSRTSSTGSRQSTQMPSRAESPDSSKVVDSVEVASQLAPRNSTKTTTIPTRISSQSTTSLSKLESRHEGGTPVKRKEDRELGKNLVGKINNLVTTDITNVVNARDFTWLVIGVPLNISLCLAFLYQLLGWSSFVGFGVMIALLPVPGYVARSIQRAQRERMNVTDARIQTVTETMSIIRMVKLFGWENRMMDRLKSKREEELTLIWKIKCLSCVSSLIGFVFPTITILATYALFTVVMQQDLTPSIVFASVPVFSMLRGQLFRLTQQSVAILQGKVSLDRLNDFFHESELLDSYLNNEPSSAASDSNANGKIGFRNALFTWSLADADAASSADRTFRLCIEGDLFFKRNAINLIVGPTGSGKTSILMALLGEMHFIPTSEDSFFNLPRKRGVAYAAQESWIQNNTIRNNILFDSEYNAERYRLVIKQCALETDLDMFDAGDATEVGEKGLTLSGGQKARITLARAIYSRAEIILLDDVLAALDVHTSSFIVENCFRGELVKDRTLIIVTHNVALVSPIADLIISMGSNGKTRTQGEHVSLTLLRDLELKKEAKENAATSSRESNLIVSDPVLKKTIIGAGKLTVSEEVVQGHVTWRSFNLFLRSLGGNHPVIYFVLVIGCLQLSQWTSNLQLWFIGYWGSQYEARSVYSVPAYLYLWGYAGIALLFCIFYSASYMLVMHGSIRASRVINERLIGSILGSTLRWLDETPIGRIIARCTHDIRAIDGPLPQAFLVVSECLSATFSKLGAIVLFTPIFLWPSLAVGIVGLSLGNVYLKAQLSVKRETSNARGPMLSYFNASMHGLTSIRAYNAEERFKEENLTRVSNYTRIMHMSYNLNRWIGIRMDFLGTSFTAALAAYLIYGPHVGASNTGFSLNMALEFATSILYFVRFYNDFEVESNSLERIQGYLEIENEPKASERGKPPASWPSSGDIRVENLHARYSPKGPWVLHNISFHIASGQRIGVVGRTGSGKSSLILAILRCIITKGEVYFDGLPTSTINLDALRTSISIIPQTPELLSGTLRENLDPFDQHDDSVLNDALDAAGLFALQEESGEARIVLDSTIASGGRNLSVGERQIIALARAMIRGSKLLILDEATSAIDYKTDTIIQRTLRTQLARGVTVITVAHRLQTIMDYDKIMVLDGGRMVEFGKPSDLLQTPGGMLRALVNESNDKETLYELAKV